MKSLQVPEVLQAASRQACPTPARRAVRFAARVDSAASARPISAIASRVPGTNRWGSAEARVTISFGGGTGVAAGAGVGEGVPSGIAS